MVRLRNFSLLFLCLGLWSTSPAQAQKYLVGLNHEKSVQIAHRSIKSMANGRVLLLELTYSQARRLAHTSGVRYVEKDERIQAQAAPNDPLYSKEWWGTDVNIFGTWSAVSNPAAVSVAVIDSGVQADHEDLVGQIDLDLSHDWVGSTGGISDPSGHGTQVAGIIAATPNNHLGGLGAAPMAKIMSLRILDQNNSGSISNAVDAIDYAVSNGAKIINNSWGFAQGSSALNDAIARARTAGVLVVSAAGESADLTSPGQNLNSTDFVPATSPGDNTITVAAEGKDHLLTAWSNYGDRVVDLAAPGVDIWAPIPTNDNGDKYATSDGTSMAAPIVSGIAAWLWGSRTTASYLTIRKAIINYGVKTRPLSGKVANQMRANAGTSWGWLQNASVKPLLVTSPSISMVGDEAFCTPGTWQGGTGTRFSYSLSVDGTVYGMRGFRYTLSDAQWNKSLICRVTASNSQGSTLALSSAIQPALPKPSNQTISSISGINGVGRDITCLPGKWLHGPMTYGYDWSLNGVLQGVTTSTYTVRSVDNGKLLRCVVTAKNNSGGSSPVDQSQTSISSPILLNWKASDVPMPPSVSIKELNLVTKYATSTTATVVVKSDLRAVVRCSLDGATAALCPASFAGLAQGDHTLAVTQTNLSGNTSAPANVSWKVDTIKPQLVSVTGTSGTPSHTISPAATGFINDTTLTLHLSGESGAIIYCILPKTSKLVTCADGQQITGMLPKQTYQLQVKQQDPAGNWSDPVNLQWSLDQTAPVAPDMGSNPYQATSGITVNTDDSIEFSGESDATFECRLDSSSDSDYHACGSGTPHSFNWRGLSLGAHSLDVRQVDHAGNRGPASSFTWTIISSDTTPPSPPVITGLPGGYINIASSALFWTGEPGGRFECNADGAGYLACTSPYTFRYTGDGAHSFYVRQADGFENMGDPAGGSWSVDRTIPGAPSLSGVPGFYTNSTSATITIQGESGAQYSYSTDGGSTWSAWSSENSVGFTNMTEKTYTLKVKQKDQAGNTGTAVTTVSWTVDTTAPSGPTLSGAPSSYTTSTAASISWGGETGATFQCSVDGGNYSSCSSPKAFSSLADGAHSLGVKQTDRAGNTSTPSTASWIVDTASPDAPSITSQPTSYASSTSASVSFSGEDAAVFQCALDSGAYSACTSPKALSSLGQGAHTLKVKQKDQAGNWSGVSTASWIVDTGVPSAPILSGVPTAYTNSIGAVISWSGESNASFACSADGGGYQDCTSPQTINDLADGAHSLSVKQADRAGNTSPAGTASWTVDTVSPDAPVLSGAPSGYTTSTSASISWSGETGATSQCSVDGGAYTTCSSPKSRTGMSDGTRSLSVRQLDRAGNYSGSSDASWVVDTTAPLAPTITQLATPSSNIAPFLSFVTSEVGGSVQCKLDSGTWGDCDSYDVMSKSGAWSLSGLTDGSHTVYVRQVDQVSNVGAADTMTWTVDTQAPIAPIVAQLVTPTNNVAPSASFTTAETGGSVKCKLDSDSWGDCTTYNSSTKAGTLAMSGLTEGSHTISVRQTDQAGNTGAVDDMTWVVDLTSPDAPVLSGAPAAYKNSTSAVTISVSNPEANATFSYSINGGTTWSAYSSSSSYTFSAQSNGSSYRIKSRQKDQAGNVSSDSTEAAWTVDASAPSAPSITQLTTPTNNTGATVNFTTTETGGTVECKLDSGSWGDCTTYISSTKAGTLGVSSLTAGSHTVSVRQTDNAGNTGATAAMTWLVDLTDPLAPSITQLTTPTNSTAASVAFVAAETLGSAQCKLDTGSWGSCTIFNTSTKAGAWSLASLAEGSHTVSVRQTDNAGNIGATAAMTWVIDLTAPSTPVLTGAPLPYSNSTSAVTVSVYNPEANATFAYSLNSGSTWSSYSASSSYTFSTQANGSSYKIRWRQKDRAGNVSADSADSAWVVDTAAPSDPVLSGAPSSYTLLTTASISMSGEAGATFSCSLDSGTYSTCTSPKAISSLADGAHSLNVKQTDQAGNASNATTATWTVDTTAPSAPSLTGPSGTTQNTSGTAAWTGETGAQFATSTDGGTTWSSWSSTASKSYSDMTAGSYSLQVKQKDQAGNESAPASLSWSVQAPTITSFTATNAAGSTIASDGSTLLSTSNISDAQTVKLDSLGTAATPLTATECQVDGGSWASCATGASVSTTLATGTQHTLNVRISTSAGTSPASTVSWKIMPTLTFDNTRGLSQGTNNGATTFNVEDPQDPSASNPTSYKVYYTSNADSNISALSYTCDRIISFASNGVTTNCASGTSLSTGYLTYSSTGAGDMYVTVKGSYGGAVTNTLSQRMHAYAPLPIVTTTSPADMGTYSQNSVGYGYTITSGTAKSCQWDTYDTNETMTGTVNFTFGCPNGGAGGTQTVNTSTVGVHQCSTCWDAVNKGATMAITGQSQDGRLTSRTTSSLRMRRINSWNFNGSGGNPNYPLVVSYPIPQCYNAAGRAAGEVTSVDSWSSYFTSSSILLMNTWCPSGPSHNFSYASAAIPIYNWGDDITFQSKLNSTYASGATMQARITSVDAYYTNSLVDMPYTSQIGYTILQDNTAYHTCKLPYNGSVIGAFLNLYIFARNSGNGSGGAYFRAFSSTGSKTGSSGSPLAGSCA